MSWTPFEEIEKRDQEIALVDKVLNAQLALTDSPIGGLVHGLTKQGKQPQIDDVTDKPEGNSSNSEAKNSQSESQPEVMQQ